jgi:hypothetical protein
MVMNHGQENMFLFIHKTQADLPQAWRQTSKGKSLCPPSQLGSKRPASAENIMGRAALKHHETGLDREELSATSHKDSPRGRPACLSHTWGGALRP